MFKRNWGTDAQTDNERHACNWKNSNNKGERKMKIKCFDLKSNENGDVTLLYKDRNYSANEFCIAINHKAEHFHDHYAQICEKAPIPFH